MFRYEKIRGPEVVYGPRSDWLIESAMIVEVIISTTTFEKRQK